MTHDVVDGPAALRWLTTFAADFAGAQQALGDLDRQAGDGDFGTNVAGALARVRAGLPGRDTATYGAVFDAVAGGFLATGGTSGPLFGMWFREIRRAAPTDAASTEHLADGVAAGLAKVRQLGGAAVGDSTMVDAISPAADALRAAADAGQGVGPALRAAARAAREGASSTAVLVAARGRASYVGDLAVGVEDPGAVTVAMFFEAGAAVLDGEPAAPTDGA